MDFELSPEQKDIKLAAREFAEGEFSEVARDYDAAEEYPFDLWKKACALGFVGVFIDEKYGGAGLGILEHLLVLEEFCRVDPGCGHILLSTTGAEIILAHGTVEQKARYLSPLTAGSSITACALADTGMADPRITSATAVRTGDGYVLNGEKAFVTNGGIANYLILLCRTDSETDSSRDRLSLFVVDTTLPGLGVVKINGRIGLRASDVATLKLTDVRVPTDCLLGGEEGKGLDQIQPFFDARRLFAAALSVGVAQGAMEQAIAYVRQRRVFGKTVGGYAATQHKIGEMATYIEAARKLCHEAAWLLDRNRGDASLISMAKWFAGETGTRVADEALQLHGGYGYMTESPIEHFLRDAAAAENYGGYKELEKISIGKELIGNT